MKDVDERRILVPFVLPIVLADFLRHLTETVENLYSKLPYVVYEEEEEEEVHDARVVKLIGRFFKLSERVSDEEIPELIGKFLETW